MSADQKSAFSESSGNIAFAPVFQYVTSACGSPSYTQVETPASVRLLQYGGKVLLNSVTFPDVLAPALGITFPATGPGPCDQ